MKKILKNFSGLLQLLFMVAGIALLIGTFLGVTVGSAYYIMNLMGV